jgi:hypothetical protein
MVSFCAVVLLFLGSLSTVVGYQTVQTSQQNLIKERINQKDLLFQTIVDIANNKEIQRIILKFQMGRGIFPTSEFPVVTKNQIKMMYFIGLVLSKVISKSRIQSMIQQYQFNNQEMQKEISAVIEKDTIINSEITQLQNSECDCENQSASEWRFPVICFVLMILFYSIYIVIGLIDFIVGGISPNMEVLLELISYIPWSIGYSLGCRFAGFGPGTR